MPQSDGAGLAISATPFGGLATDRADRAVLLLDGDKAPAMRKAMAVYAERAAIGNVKAQSGEASECLNMMCVEIGTGIATLLAGERIALEDGGAPFSELASQSGALASKGVPIFPCIGSRPDARLASTGPRAKPLTEAFGSSEGRAAGRAHLGLRGIAVGPAILGAELRGVGAVSFDCERLATDLTHEGDLRVLHRAMIAQHANNSKYIAVTLQRLADMGLSPQLIEHA